MPKWNRSHKEKGQPAQARKRRALELLEQDLKTGRIRTAGERTSDLIDDKGLTRIKKEIENLKAKM